jgi:hypothetical protein
VIVHQHIGVDVDLALIGASSQFFKESRSIRVVLEDWAPIHSSMHDVHGNISRVSPLTLAHCDTPPNQVVRVSRPDVSRGHGCMLEGLAEIT